MRWNDAKTLQPENEQEVLVRINGHCNKAVYNEKTGGYRLPDGSVWLTRFDSIEWLPSEEKT